MFQQAGRGYDMAITQFSPEGRLFQVEYAIEAVRRGTTAIVCRNSNSVVFTVEKKKSELQEVIGSEKIFKVEFPTNLQEVMTDAEIERRGNFGIDGLLGRSSTLEITHYTDPHGPTVPGTEMCTQNVISTAIIKFAIGIYQEIVANI